MKYSILEELTNAYGYALRFDQIAYRIGASNGKTFLALRYMEQHGLVRRVSLDRWALELD